MCKLLIVNQFQNDFFFKFYYLIQEYWWNILPVNVSYIGSQFVYCFEESLGHSRSWHHPQWEKTHRAHCVCQDASEKYTKLTTLSPLPSVPIPSLLVVEFRSVTHSYFFSFQKELNCAWIFYFVSFYAKKPCVYESL